ncbi:PREDICTED: bone morphogenetic protein 10-like [Cyprinodon variegatus]|uniref:Bone morphogenetic protein 10, like n=1 Tax=Cyprinodon variegatus TaxID=28743 RepID=A0A3Q2EI84_CYPVA|nr:PREDICTED: bone morphogenetic protein 10-like [Cyprinodon variegatus]
MTTLFFSNLGLINIVIVALTGLSCSSPIKSAETHHRTLVGMDAIDNPLHSAQDFLSHFLSTLNLTRLRSQPRMPTTQKEPLSEYMLELYNRFANDRTAVPSASIVRSFKNEDYSLQNIGTTGVRIHPLLFNISVPHHEHITTAELRLFMLARKAQKHAGFSCRVTIYKIHDGAVWTKEVGKEGRGRDKEEVAGMEDVEELVTKHIHARDNSWVSFDLTHVVTLWQKSGYAAHRLEVHIESLGADQQMAMQQEIGGGKSLMEVDIDRSKEGQHNSVIIVFSDESTRDQKEDRQQLRSQMIRHENDLPDNTITSQQPLIESANRNSDHPEQDDLDEQSVLELQSNLIYDTPPRNRRSANHESCRRTPLYVEFKDIGWDSWIIQPQGYEAYKCNGVCSTPMTSEVSPTKHAIVQTRLSLKHPEQTTAACCVPTKLKPISLLYRDNDVVTFNHKYEGMVVAECGCR